MGAHRRFYLKNGELCYGKEGESVSEALENLPKFRAKETLRDEACVCIDVSRSPSSCIFRVPGDEIAKISTKDSLIYVFWASNPEGRDRLVLWEEMDDGMSLPDEQKLLVVDEESEAWQVMPISNRKVRMFESSVKARTALQNISQDIRS
ncbi:MAG: hypothetical protein WCT28_00155 [Patescibacteria group bacterium]|jgi:hypothetical protein